MGDKKPTFYEVGYYDGFHGKPMASRNLDYWSGYAHGERDREERENGYKPGVDGGQW